MTRLILHICIYLIEPKIESVLMKPATFLELHNKEQDHPKVNSFFIKSICFQLDKSTKMSIEKQNYTYNCIIDSTSNQKLAATKRCECCF